MAISGKTPDGKFVEIAEIPDHPWYVAVQFHPEFQSKPLVPHPLFADFVRASLENRRPRAGGRGRAVPVASALVKAGGLRPGPLWRASRGAGARPS